MKVDEVSVLARAKVHAALGDPVRLTIVDRLRLADASPAELLEITGVASNLLAHHLGILTSAGIVSRHRSEGDRRRIYVRLLPEVITDLDVTFQSFPTRIVFVCTRNSGRSQLAAALWRAHSQVPVASAGTQPARQVHPQAVNVAHRHGLHISPDQTSHITDVENTGDLVVVVCDNAHESMPKPSTRLHWSVRDPAAAGTADAFESAFAEIRQRITQVVPILTNGSGLREHGMPWTS